MTISRLNPKIHFFKRTFLAGQCMQMSLLENRTFELWNGFQAQRKKHQLVSGKVLYSMQVYDHELYFAHFNPATKFTKWAAIEVTTHEHLPEGLKPYIIEGGLYAVFLYQGMPQRFGPFMQEIVGNWMPASEYELDHREHFELLGDLYKRDSPESQEEVWIPIRLKSA
jgi:AraC family transcriptional regulator